MTSSTFLLPLCCSLCLTYGEMSPWRLVSTDGPPRTDHAMSYLNEHFYIFGGIANELVVNETWKVIKRRLRIQIIMKMMIVYHC